MVGVLGGGLAHIRLADGRHIVLDGLSTAPGKAAPDMYEALSHEIGKARDTRDRENVVGPKSVAVPGALAGWCEALARFGTMPLADVLAPAIALAERGFVASPYLSDCIADCAADIARDAGLSRLFLPGGQPLAAGARLTQPDYAQSLRLIAASGPRSLYDGPLGAALTRHMAAQGGLIDQADLSAYAPIQREAVRGAYRGYEILGPPPPSSSGVHIVQMLNILEGYDIGALGFGTPDGVHLLAEALKIAFADRAVATADSGLRHGPGRAADRQGLCARAPRRHRHDPHEGLGTGPSQPGESANTTHVTVADAAGNVVSTTQTINGLFGACTLIPGTGMLANNYMFNFRPASRPRPCRSRRGKRVFTSMAPMMALRDGRLAFALGLPGGLRIFPSAMQAIVNLIDHGMSVQEAVEAPRIWTEGGVLELEPGFFGSARHRAGRARPRHRPCRPHRRRDERHRLFSRRDDDRGRLLARRRHASRRLRRGWRARVCGFRSEAGAELPSAAAELVLPVRAESAGCSTARTARRRRGRRAPAHFRRWAWRWPGRAGDRR